MFGTTKQHPSITPTLSLTRLACAVALVGTVTGSIQAQEPFLPAMAISELQQGQAINENSIQLSDDGLHAVFLASESFTQEIFSASLSGDGMVRLNPDLASGGDVNVVDAVSRSVVPFQISSDSQQVVYIADQRSNDLFELFSVPITGGEAIRLSGDLPGGGDVGSIGSFEEFQITPDGQNVVYIAEQNVSTVSELFIVPITGGTPVQLSAQLAGAGSDVVDFQISPDGLNVVYLADQIDSDQFEIFSVPTAGGTAVPLNGELVSLGDVDAFEISSDSARVVYLADQNLFGHTELFSVAIAGGPATRLNGDFVDADGFSQVLTFQISPDGQTVAYVGDQDIDSTDEIFSVPILGGTPVRLNADLIDDGNVLQEFEISPDSQTLVYLADQTFVSDFELFSVPLAGGQVVQLSESGTPINLSQFLSSLPDNAFDISPDSQQVVLWPLSQAPTEIY